MKRQHHPENELSEFRITAQRRDKEYEFNIITNKLEHPNMLSVQGLTLAALTSQPASFFLSSGTTALIACPRA